MANEVIKKDGRREPFDGDKIRRSIEMASRDAGLPANRVSEITERVAESAIQFATDKDEVTTGELRERILTELNDVEPSVADAWRRYDETKKK
ncbi:MAG: hypothetical protein HYS43_00555 [Candidatus Liptonbacteria bacterium]|nr:hypothetical protein [Candidatus Liptonbacteria bacterium]